MHYYSCIITCLNPLYAIDVISRLFSLVTNDAISRHSYTVASNDARFYSRMQLRVFSTQP